MANSLAWIKLTAPNGEPVWIAPSWVVRITPAGSDAPHNALTDIHLGGGVQFVLEPIEDVLKLLSRQPRDSRLP